MAESLFVCASAGEQLMPSSMDSWVGGWFDRARTIFLADLVRCGREADVDAVTFPPLEA